MSGSTPTSPTLLGSGSSSGGGGGGGGGSATARAFLWVGHAAD